MLEVYNFILNNLIENNGVCKIYISLMNINGEDVILIPGMIKYINKEELLNSLKEDGFNIESSLIHGREILEISINKEMLDKRKKYQK